MYVFEEMSGHRTGHSEKEMRRDVALLWAVRRQPDDHPDAVVESIREENGGLFYERVTSELSQATFPDLQLGPYADIVELTSAHPELLLLRLRHDDEVITCKLSDEDVLKHVNLDDEESDGVDVELGERWFLYVGFLIPSNLEHYPIAAWSNDDDYDYPGGDRETRLHRVGTTYIVCNNWSGWEIFGYHASDQQAIEAWGERDVPGWPLN